jgi:hypothetical protein
LGRIYTRSSFAIKYISYWLCERQFREDFKQLVYNVNVNNIDNITDIKIYGRADDTKNRTMILDLLKEANEVKVKDVLKKTMAPLCMPSRV